MSKESERLELRGRMLETMIQQALRINDLETRLLKQEVRKALKKQRRRRRVQLKCLAELDQINADVHRQIEIEKDS